MNYKINTEAIEAVNAGDSVPSRIEGGEFMINWKATDGWRGYYEVKPTKKSGWELVDSNWVTGNYSDAGDNASDKQEARIEKLSEELAKEGKEVIVVLSPTSNVFSTGMDVFSRLIK